jgi:hypothetical protein
MSAKGSSTLHTYIHSNLLDKTVHKRAKLCPNILLQCFHEFDVKWTFWTDAFVLVHKKNISSDHVLSAQPVDIVKKADFFTYGFSSDTRRSEKGWMLQNSLKLFSRN